MTIAKRRRLLFLLILVFMAFTPLLIFYSLGYRFDFSTITVEKTGGIFLKSKTPRVSVRLDGKFSTETSFFSGGVLLTDIRPGTHLVRLEKKDYHPWFKTIEVAPMVVTEVRNIILIANPVPTATSTKEELAAIAAIPSHEEKILYLDAKANLIEKQAPGIEDIIASNVNSFASFDGTVFWIDKNGFLASRNPETKAIRTLGRPGFYLRKEPARFFKSPAGAIVILDASGGVFLVEGGDTITPLHGGVMTIRFDAEGKKLLWIKEEEVGIVWLADNPYQPFQRVKTKETIIAVNTKIEDALWFYGDNAHIILRTHDGTYLTEIDGRGDRNTAELVSGLVDALVTTPQIPNGIFFRKGVVWKTIKL